MQRQNLIPGSGRSPREGNGNLLQYSCLENLLDSGAWWLQCKGLQRVGLKRLSSSSSSSSRKHNRTSQLVLVVKNPPANIEDIRDMGSGPGLGRSPGGGHGDSFQSSCLENPMDRGACWATVYRIAKSQTQLK